MPNKDTQEYIKVEDGFLLIRQKIGPGNLSKQGKSRIVVGTGGFQDIAGTNLRISMNVIAPLK